MRHLLNTLFVTTENAYLSLDGENILIHREKEIIGRYPLHILQGIMCFSYAGASPALMGACAERNISLSFCSPRGKFLARACGKSSGNVLLRRMQYRIADDPQDSCLLARGFILGKVYNGKASLERSLRNHRMRLDADLLMQAVDSIKQILPQIAAETSMEALRGMEGKAAAVYFGCLDQLILNNKEAFYFQRRNRRPPLDKVNALLSFAYSLLVTECASALESVGLDSYVGFLHRDRPGRISLALDLMEELRPCFADRFVLTMINNRVISPEDFDTQESGAVLIKDSARRTFLKQWQQKKQVIITHPYLGEKIPWGLVPYVQALLLARYLRGDVDAYPPFFWK